MDSKHSTRPRRAARRSKARKRTGAKLPDLRAIFQALVDAISLVHTAHMAMRYSDHWGPEEFTLCTGIEALQRVRNDLDRADGQISRRRRAKP